MSITDNKLSYKLIKHDDKEFDNDIRAIRDKVFIEEQGVPKELEYDEYDKNSDYILVYHLNIPIATARLACFNGEYHLGRIAVLKEYRGKDIGRYMINNMKTLAKSMKINKLLIGAQCQAIGFYKKLGFIEYGEAFLEAGIEHKNMYIDL